VTGAGPIGSQIALHEVEKGEKVVLFDINPQLESISTVLDPRAVTIVKGNILDPYDIVSAIKKLNVDRVIHTVVNPGQIWGGYANPREALQINLMGTTNVLEAVRILNLQRIVFISSDALYHAMVGGEDKGGFGRENAFPRPSELYGTAKLACEHIGLNYVDMFGIDFVTLRYPAVFGPWPLGGGGLPARMFYQIIQDAANNKPTKLMRIWAEYLYSKDAGRAASIANHKTGLKDRVFNIGTGIIYTPEQVMNILRHAFPDLKVEFEESVDASRAPKAAAPMSLIRSKEQLGYEPEYTLEKALLDLMKWYKSIH
jgi:nucleoside-diphosphate-sugar epimerase